MIPEIEDSVIDFNWTDDVHMQTQENLSRNANENSERMKELLRKLNRRKSRGIFSKFHDSSLPSVQCLNI